MSSTENLIVTQNYAVVVGVEFIERHNPQDYTIIEKHQSFKKEATIIKSTRYCGKPGPQLRLDMSLLIYDPKYEKSKDGKRQT